MFRGTLMALAFLSIAVSASAQKYSIAVIGDMPYVVNQEQRDFYLPRYHRLLARLDSADVAMVVHLGDFTTGAFCGDSVVDQRYAEYSHSLHPFVFIFGDNDWSDCARGGFDPLERLRKLRSVFTRGHNTLGKTTLPLVRQSDNPVFVQFRENLRWTLGNELYVGMNVTGHFNNWGKDSEPSTEYVRRNAANLAWLRESFELAMRNQHRAVIIMMQADPGLEDLPYRRRPEDEKGFTDFNRELVRLANDFGKPVLLVHGDTHYFRVDNPYVDAGSGHTITNITRLEGYAHPNYHWVRISVDPADPHVFRITPEIIPEHR